MVYKIKHIPTGLFIQPIQSFSNLSKRGKIYERDTMWARIQNRSEYTSLYVYFYSGLFKTLAEKFPDNVKECGWRGKNMIVFYTKPEDFEKVII